jgi:hypothetical protein
MHEEKLKLEIECNIHFHDHSHSAALEVKIDRILHLQEKIMTVAEDLRAELGTINETTNEIAADVATLIGLVGEGSVSATDAAELKAGLVALKEKLEGVDASYPPVPPSDTPV